MGPARPVRSAPGRQPFHQRRAQPPSCLCALRRLVHFAAAYSGCEVHSASLRSISGARGAVRAILVLAGDSLATCATSMHSPPGRRLSCRCSSAECLAAPDTSAPCRGCASHACDRQRSVGASGSRSPPRTHRSYRGSSAGLACVIGSRFAQHTRNSPCQDPSLRCPQAFFVFFDVRSPARRARCLPNSTGTYP